MAHSGDFLAGSGLPLDRFGVKMAPEGYAGQVGKYGKQFDINMSRISARGRHVPDGMLAYSEHVTRTSQSRLLAASMPDVSLLRVRAHHIPEAKRGRKLRPLAPLGGGGGGGGDHDDAPAMSDPFRRKIEKLREERKSLEEEGETDEEEEAAEEREENGRRIRKLVAAVPQDDRIRKVHLPPRPVIGVPNLDELIRNRRQHHPRSRSVWIPIEGASGSTMTTSTDESALSPTNAIVLDSLRESDDTDSMASAPFDDSPAARAERSRKRREAKTRLLLRDAIASLQELEQNINNNPPTAPFPGRKRAKRLALPKNTLDVIPEIRREDCPEADPEAADRTDGDGTDTSAAISTWRSEPGYKSRQYRHSYPESGNATTLDDGKYSIRSDPFQWRTPKGQQQQQQQQQQQKQQRMANRRASGEPEPLPAVGRRGLHHQQQQQQQQQQQRYDPDMHTKDRKRRLQEHARIRLRKPTKFKFLTKDPD